MQNTQSRSSVLEYMQVQTRLLFMIARAQEQHQQNPAMPYPDSRVPSLLQPVAIANCEDLITGLEDEYNRSVRPIMDYLQQQKSAMGERYPQAMFMPPVLTSAADCEKMLSGMRVRAALVGRQMLNLLHPADTLVISDSLYHS